MNHSFSIIPLTVEARGEVISSNIDEFRELVREALGNINRDLKSDEDFGQAELDAKALKEAEDAVKASKDKALADAESLHALFAAMDETSEEIRAARLDLENQIKKRKEEIKGEIVEEFLGKFDIDASMARKHYLKGLQEAIKGKRTLESMRTACRIHQATMQEGITKSREAIARFEKAHGPDLTMDRRELEIQKLDAVDAELRRRFEAKKAADEAARLKAEAAAEASKLREEAAKAKAEAAAEASKLREEAAKAKAEAAAANKKAEEASKPPVAAVENPAKEAEESAPWDGKKAAKAEVQAVDGQTAREEWVEFSATFIAAFRPVKEARGKLKHSANIAKAQGLANALNKAWEEWK